MKIEQLKTTMEEKSGGYGGAIIVFLVVLGLIYPFISDLWISSQQTESSTGDAGSNTSKPSSDASKENKSRANNDTVIEPEEASISMSKQEGDGVVLGDQTSDWRCVCENGFLPPNLLKSLGGAESVIRMGAGQCYHKTR